MKLPTNDRYDYVSIKDRVPYDWPNGTRLAVCLSNNIEHFAYRAGLGVNDSAVNAPANYRSYAWRDYGNRIGIWRMFDAFDELDIPWSHNVNSTVMQSYPDIVAKIIERGDEIIAHGRTNSERSDGLWEEDEARLISETTEVITQHWGRRPSGWLGPYIAESPVTSDLLVEAGYTYTLQSPCDDQPIWLRTRSGPLLSIPYPLELNDVGVYILRHNPPPVFAEMMIDQFDEMLRLAEEQPLVYSISLHTFLVGQPFRLKHLRAALEHIAARRDEVWLARPEDIAAHVMSLPPGTIPGSRPAAG